jgi:hypothetical protein
VIAPGDQGGRGLESNMAISSVSLCVVVGMISKTSRRAAAGLIALALAMTGSGALGAAPAAAGTYTVYGCDTPSGSTAPLSGWSDALHVYPAGWKNSCPNATFMWMDPSTAHGEGTYAEETFVAPPDTTIASYTLIRAVRLMPSGGYYYQALADTNGFWEMVDGCNTYGGCHSFGDYKKESSPANNLTRTPVGGATTAVQLKLLCGRPGGCLPEPGHVSASVWLFRSQMTLRDDAAPVFTSAPSGPLVSGGVLSGAEPVSISASDPGSGVYQAQVQVDGKRVQTQVLDNSTGTCRQPFVAAAPCPLSASGTVDFDTSALSDGPHSLRLIITDAAGNTTSWGPVTITTANNPCSTVPTAHGMAVHAAFAERVRRRTRYLSHITTSYGQRPNVVGSLTGMAGAGIPNAPVCVAVRDHYGGAPFREQTSLTTDASGHFRYRIGRGPSRTIYFIHRVRGGAVWDAVSVKVHAPARVRINSHHLHNGQVMVWRGKLPGRIPGGMLALMQVDRGRYWQTFQTVAVGRKGRWVGRYRFRFTTGVQPYTFRLVVPQQSGYPYARGISSPIHVVVTG